MATTETKPAEPITTSVGDPANTAPAPAEVAAPVEDQIMAGPESTTLTFGRGKINTERASKLLVIVTSKGYGDNGRSIATATNGVKYADEKAAKAAAASYKRDLQSVAPAEKRASVAIVDNAFVLYLANKGKPRGPKAATPAATPTA